MNPTLLFLRFLIEETATKSLKLSLSKSDKSLRIYVARKSKSLAASKPEGSLFSFMLKFKEFDQKHVPGPVF